MFAVVAQVEINYPTGYTSSLQVPTFYLNGYLDREAAQAVAEDCIDPTNMIRNGGGILHVSLEKV